MIKMREHVSAHIYECITSSRLYHNIPLSILQSSRLKTSVSVTCLVYFGSHNPDSFFIACSLSTFNEFLVTENVSLKIKAKFFVY